MKPILDKIYAVFYFIIMVTLILIGLINIAYAVFEKDWVNLPLGVGFILAPLIFYWLRKLDRISEEVEKGLKEDV